MKDLSDPYGRRTIDWSQLYLFRHRKFDMKVSIPSQTIDAAIGTAIETRQLLDEDKSLNLIARAVSAYLASDAPDQVGLQHCFDLLDSYVASEANLFIAIEKADADNEVFCNERHVAMDDAITRERESLLVARDQLEYAKSEKTLKEACEEVSKQVNALPTKHQSETKIEIISSNQDDLKRQQEVLDKYAESVGKAVLGTLSLSKVFDDQVKAAEALEKANSVVTDAQTSLANEQTKHAEKVAAAQTKLNEVYAEYLDAFNSGDFKSALSLQKQVITANNQLGATEADIAEVTKAQTALGAATSAASKAQSEQITFLARLQKQADLAVGFAERIGKLTKANLSQEALDQIIAAGATTGTAIADELLAGGSVAIDKTNELFALIGETGKTVGKEVASKFYSVGELMGMDFMKALIKEADKAKLFADRVRQLAEAGLSKEALAQVLAAGADAGTAIADYLLVAGSDRITSTNDILSALQTTADQLGELLGSKFYQAGVDLAQQIVDGLTSKLAEVKKLLKDISTVEGAKKLFETVKGNVNTIAATTTATTGTGAVKVGGEMKAVTEGRLTLEQAQALMARRYGAMPMLATGGIVSKPTVAMIGESGAEAVIPLSKLGSLGGGTSINLTVNAGMGANGASIGQEIVDQLVRWERRNGRVPITTGS